MREGELIADGSPAAIRERTGACDVEHAFLSLDRDHAGTGGEGAR